MGVSLVEGDLDLSVTGTVTHIDRDRVYAFGHPFYNLGPTQFPMRKAYVLLGVPEPVPVLEDRLRHGRVGTIDQDRTTAVSGQLGPLPRMMGVEVRLRSPRPASACSASASSRTSCSRRC